MRFQGDWCAENDVSRDLPEAALAHAIKDKTEAAYNCTSMVEKRARSNATLCRLRLCPRQLLNLRSPVKNTSPI